MRNHLDPYPDQTEVGLMVKLHRAAKEPVEEYQSEDDMI